MTVQELIEALEAIEDREAFVEDADGTLITKVFESEDGVVVVK